MKENSNNKNNKYFKIGANGLLIVCGGIFFYYILFHSDRLYGLLGTLLTVMTPLISGLVIAYILNPLMRFFENKLFFPLWNRIKPRKITYSKEKITIRVISTVLTLLLFIALICALCISLIPQIIVNIQSIINRFPGYIVKLNDHYSSFLNEYPKLQALIEQYNVDIYNWFYEKAEPVLEKFISEYSTSLIGSIITIFKNVLNCIIGLIISVYLLVSKEKFIAQGKKVIYALLHEEKANNFINNLRYSDKIFGGFITGKVIDSIIIGIMCYIGVLILKMPYPVLIAVVVGVTNVIPYFGPFIGAIPSAFIILMVDPKKCLIFLIFILILQQFDGNILGPKILGDSTGLNSFWVIFSITVFSGLLGVLGMFIGVPLFAVIYAAFRTFVNQRLEHKQLPVETQYYISSDFIPETEDKVDNDGKSFRFTKKTFEKILPEFVKDNINEIKNELGPETDPGKNIINNNQSENSNESENK